MQWPNDLWPHQVFGCEAVVNAIRAGRRRLVLTSPTGMGKSRMMMELVKRAAGEWQRSALYTHRRLLFAQTCGVLEKNEIPYGCRAAGYKPRLLADTQICMTASEVSAVYRKKRRELHPASLVLADELHAQGGDTLPTILADHYNMGAAVVGVTATPLDLIGDWDELIVAGTTADGRDCGALVPAFTYCPDEPDLRHIKKYRVGEDLTDKDNAKVMMRPGIFGRVLTHYRKLNPNQVPTILFAPDVAGSIYFAEQFYKHDIRAAHIDAKQIWLDGEYMDSSDENRAAILQMFRNNDIAILCNRFVLREGIDIPEVGCAIFATIFGSLTSYLQAGGRALRSHPSLDHVIIIDHGANYRRHGSLNASRHWELGMTSYKLTGIREEQMRENSDLEPIICPKCGMARLSGPVCEPVPPGCGFSCRKRSRLVVQIDGSLKPVEGAAYKPRFVKREDDTEDKWVECYYRAKSKKWDATFREAEALFVKENGYWPPHDLRLMPHQLSDFFEKVNQVPMERLR